MSVKILMQLEGAQKVRSIFAHLPPSLRRHVRDAIAETTQAVERGAKMRVPVSGGGRQSRKATSRPGPGELRDTIRSAVHEDEGGIAGFVNAGYGKLRRRITGSTSKRKSARKRAANILKRRQQSGAQKSLGVYAMVVEYGSPREKKAAKPYLRPALEAEKPRHNQRMTRAIRRATAESVATSGRTA